MSILRRDPLSYGWTIFLEEDFPSSLAQCPNDISLPPEKCPFCPGHEEETPPEIAALRSPNSKPNRPGWRVRTIPDRNAVLRIEGQLSKRGEGLYDMMNGIGAHEIVIESPDHYRHLSQFSRSEIYDVLWMYRERVKDLLNDQRFRYVQVCRNYGARAGARLPHPHSLIIALPITPRWVREEIARAYEHWQMKERCVFCDIIAQDEQSSRDVCVNADFIALEPFAARMPYETWIYPREHQWYFHDITDEQLQSLADILKRTTLALERQLGDAAYNLIVHTAPVRGERQYETEHVKLSAYYHWHIEIIPRTEELSGFEYGTGIYVNPVLPEKAAIALRQKFDEIDAEFQQGLLS